MGSAHARPQSKVGRRTESIEPSEPTVSAADFVGHLSQRVAQVRDGIVVLNSAIIPTEKGERERERDTAKEKHCRKS